jgi:hypothetical protein
MMKSFHLQAELKFVMPANAGIQIRFGSSSKTAWIPPEWRE